MRLLNSRIILGTILNWMLIFKTISLKKTISHSDGIRVRCINVLKTLIKFGITAALKSEKKIKNTRT